ncbi:hypothetical protein [Agriterribacter sp.]|uniref:hypothetical protein n=1 Tax=Agriterribacter sp. TaxID=2821509 RepID=UPI002C0456C7|nr:hypothetical protein [Agriterribacter sp.]HTN08412.1 hypothetical protein [Agriterribacter sp.]
MKKLKLNFQDFKSTEVLTREHLKTIIGGDGGSGGSCPNGYWWLVCTTPGGVEWWCRSSNSGNANMLCEGIYPAYNPDNVSGEWSPVINTGG